jgi:dTDP-4-amino-4,6-dideoxygalactose transaminase
VNAGLTPIFVDVTDDFGIDLTALSNLLDDSVSAVIVVHLYGYPQNVGAIKDALDQREIKILEDCAQAHGAKFDEQHVGTMGDVGAFSFYPGKNLGALGDAGAIITNDAQLAESCRRISNHGRLSKFDHNIIGRNSRLDALQATVLSLKLKFLDTWNSRRRSNAETYRDLLGDLEGIVLPPLSQGYEVYHHFVIKTKQRDGLRSHLEKSGISTGIHYPESISAMKAFEHLDPVQCPVSDRLSAEMISLPVAEHLGRAEVEIVARSIRDFVLESKRPL